MVCITFCRRGVRSVSCGLKARLLAVQAQKRLLSLSLKRKGRFAEPLEEKMNHVCKGFTPDNAATEQFAFQVSWLE